MYRLLNRHVNGLFERVTLATVDEIPLPAPEPCAHLLGEWGADGEIICAECGAYLNQEE